MEIENASLRGVLREDIINFMSACGQGLLSDIQLSGDPLTFGFYDNGVSYLVSVVPSVRKETLDGLIAIRVDRIKKHFLLPPRYEPILQEEINMRLKLVDDRDIGRILEHALKEISPFSKVGIANSREPLTFSCNNKQAEVLFEKEGMGITTHVHIN